MNLRFVAGVAMAATAALVLAGCTSSGGEDTDNPTDDVVLTFGAWQFLEPNRGDELYDLVSSYSDEVPSVSIEKEEITRDDYEKTISTELGSGSGPDIFVIPDAFYPQLVSAGLLEPLDDAVEEAEPAAFRPLNENYSDDGKQYAVLWSMVPYALYWNKDILEDAGVEAPKNVDELVQAMKKIKEKTGKTAFTVRHQMNEESAWWTDFSNWTFGYGGSWSDGEHLTIDSAENIEALEAFKKVYSGEGFGTGQDASTYRSAFSSGELAMSIDNSAALLTQVSEDVPSDQIGSELLPFPAGGSAYVGISVGVNANSPHVEEAKDWIRWMLTADVQPRFADQLFPSPIATETKASSELMDANPWADAFFEQANNAKSVVIPGFEDDTSEIAHQVLKQVAAVLTDDLPAKQALEKAQKESESIS